MSHVCILYFSDEENGIGYNIGEANNKIVVERLFVGADVQRYTFEKKGKILKVEFNGTFDPSISDKTCEALTFKFKDGKRVRPYVAAMLL